MKKNFMPFNSKQIDFLNWPELHMMNMLRTGTRCSVKWKRKASRCYAKLPKMWKTPGNGLRMGEKKNIHTHKKQLEIRLSSSMCKPFYHFRIVRIISFSPKQSRAERDWESEWERGGQMCDYRDLCQRMKCDCAYLWWYQCGRNGSLWTTNRVWWQLSAQCFISFFNSIQFDVRHFQHANSANHSSRRHRLLARESSLWRYSSFFFLSSIPNIFFTPTHSRRCHRHHCTFCFGFHSIRFFCVHHFSLSLHVFLSVELPFNVSTFFSVRFHVYLYICTMFALPLRGIDGICWAL